MSSADEWLGWTICGVFASALTFFELARTFYTPEAGLARHKFFGWASAFVLGNGLLSLAVYLAFSGLDNLKNMKPLLRGILMGTGYLVLIRLKIATVKVRDEEVPLGLEFFYNSARDFFYGKLNRCSKEGLQEAAFKRAESSSLADLAKQAKFSIENDPLFKDEEKTSRKAWLLKVITDPGATDEDKKLVIAAYLLTEKRSS
ncbi:MAG: hypothetical protein ABSG65_10745 [Bryobacteraceae bacterium]